MEKYRGRVALVTGASSGIGREMCKFLIKSGMTVVGVSRNTQSILVIIILSVIYICILFILISAKTLTIKNYNKGLLFLKQFGAFERKSSKSFLHDIILPLLKAFF